MPAGSALWRHGHLEAVDTWSRKVQDNAEGRGLGKGREKPVPPIQKPEYVRPPGVQSARQERQVGRNYTGST